MIKILNTLLESIFEISLSTSFLFLLILIFTNPIRKYYSTQWKYLLYLIIAIRLIIPINLNIFEPKVQVTSNNITVQGILLNTTLTSNTHEDDFNIPKTTYMISNKSLASKVKSNLPLIYSLGLFIFIFATLSRYFTTYKSIMRWSLPLSDKKIIQLENKLCDKLCIKTPIKILKVKQ